MDHVMNDLIKFLNQNITDFKVEDISDLMFLEITAYKTQLEFYVQIWRVVNIQIPYFENSVEKIIVLVQVLMTIRKMLKKSIDIIKLYFIRLKDIVIIEEEDNDKDDEDGNDHEYDNNNNNDDDFENQMSTTIQEYSKYF
ncbi:hypothetical protein RhiirB3_434400 [Rhizophagus irregularis]|nr:hypothetical protein RhiirB3_434400 [Rhizophagus irregularis]